MTEFEDALLAQRFKRVQAETHTFQNVRPFHPLANAVCPRCGLALPHGFVMATLLPCAATFVVQNP